MILQYGISSCPSDWIVDEQKPPGYSRLYFVMGGEIRYKDRECDRPLFPHHLYIFPTSVPYTIRQNPENPLECMYFHLDFYPGDLLSLSEIPLWDHPVMESIFESLEYSIHKNDLSMIKGFIDLLILYCREQGLLHFSRSPLSPILEYIAEDPGRDLSIDILSRRAGYNEQYFIRLFKSELGVTPYQYIIGYRMKEARTLLKTRRSITEVAESTGFADVKAFSRAFRKNNGMSPSEFRKSPLSGP
jgi:AraC family transcriptional regulator of arabinose operon